MWCNKSWHSIYYRSFYDLFLRKKKTTEQPGLFCFEEKYFAGPTSRPRSSSWQDLLKVARRYSEYCMLKLDNNAGQSDRQNWLCVHQDQTALLSFQTSTSVNSTVHSETIPRSSVLHKNSTELLLTGLHTLHMYTSDSIIFTRKGQ